MNLFDILNPNFFSPLTGVNKHRYADIISLIWDRCSQNPLYSIEKSTLLDEVESYFIGLEQIGEGDIPLDEEEISGEDKPEDTGSTTPRFWASHYLRRLKHAGWLEEREGGYDDEARYAVNHRIIPIIQAFIDVISPKMVTYQGKLYKIYTLLSGIGTQANPYETVLKEVEEDMEDLNISLRQLASSIEDHMEQLTQGKTPVEILELFNAYEEKVVVGAYHRFKTSETLFYYRAELFGMLERCEDEYKEQLELDYAQIMGVPADEAGLQIRRLLYKLRDEIKEMGNIIRIIDESHVLYRSRAVQRAQFLLLSDGSVKSKISTILQYYAASMQTKEEMLEYDEGLASQMFQIYIQGYFCPESLQKPVTRRKPTEIEDMEVLEPIDEEVLKREQERLLKIAREALTEENVNQYANQLLQEHQAVEAGSLTEGEDEQMVKLIGLYTYSQSRERTYDIEVKNRVIKKGKARFTDFTIEKKR